jgi:putative dimethyl sulfoxide reductase chaperone
MTQPANIDLAHARASLYSLFAELFDKPLSASALAAVRAPEMSAALVAAGIDPGPGFASANVTELREQLSIEFSDLFVSPIGKIMPYEGLMIGSEDELDGDTASHVARFMANVGYHLPPENGMVADHISVELAFMADLAEREADALTKGDMELAARSGEIQRNFLTQHLGSWTGIFADRIRARAKPGFYAMAATALDEFMAGETLIGH